MDRRAGLFGLLLCVWACSSPKDPTATESSSSGAGTSCERGGACSGESTCSPAPIGTGWAHAFVCSNGKWTDLEIAPLPQPPMPSSASPVVPAPSASTAMSAQPMR